MNSRQLFNYLTEKFKGQAEIVSTSVTDHFAYPTSSEKKETVEIVVFYKVNGEQTNARGYNYYDADFAFALKTLEKSILKTIEEIQDEINEAVTNTIEA